MNSDPHYTILETYFFGYIDRGVGADETPLFTCRLDERPLAVAVADEFQISPTSAEEAIDLAQREVAL
ncbi:MAG: hypothetical protein J0I10_02035 [Verrucomicrobia bacterium]|nr:hypothetical protein [Verrucomicrobiota bacterium]